MSKMLDHFMALRRISAPLVAVGTLDPAACIASMVAAVEARALERWEKANGKKKMPESEHPLSVHWDCSRGLVPIGDETSPASRLLAQALMDMAVETNPNPKLEPKTPDPSSFTSPPQVLSVARYLPQRTSLYMMGVHRFISDEAGNASLAALTIQALWNLRDDFKKNQRTLILVGPSGIRLPVELAQDFVVLEEELPGRELLQAKVIESFESVKLPDGRSLPKPSPEVLDKCADALRGLSMFTAEQVTASCLRSDLKTGIDLDLLWERKRLMVEQTPGIMVYRGQERLDDLGGLLNIKTFLRLLIKGRRPPKLVVFIDELEKGIAGATGNGPGDNTGVAQDILQNLLTFMEDHQSKGLIFVGPPGGGKSGAAKAIGAEAGVLTVQLDIGGLKTALLGQSEMRVRQALKVIQAVSDGEVLFVATVNREADLPPELKRRFSLGTFIFDLPNAAEREAIWVIWTTKYGIKEKSFPLEKPYTGAEIRNVCDIADRLQITLAEASQYIIPVAISGAAQLDKIREAANGKFLSASFPGLYVKVGAKPSGTTQVGKRMIEPDDGGSDPDSTLM